MLFAWLRQNQRLKDFIKSNIYLMKLAHRLLEQFDIFLPLERDYEIVSFLPHQKSQIILDLGAHKGESVRSFRKFDSSPILSIEANSSHKKDLEKLKQKTKDFDYKIAIATDHSKTETLYIPSYQGQELTVWSSSNEAAARKIFADRTSLKDLNSHLEFKTVQSQAIKLDELNLDPFLIKIDVEGAELKVLEGLQQTLIKNHPVLMIENNDHPSIYKLLEPLAYQPYIYDAKIQKFKPYKKQSHLNLIYLSENSPVYNKLLDYIQLDSVPS